MAIRLKDDAWWTSEILPRIHISTYQGFGYREVEEETFAVEDLQNRESKNFEKGAHS
jgi:hypothetical protein